MIYYIWGKVELCKSSEYFIVDNAFRISPALGLVYFKNSEFKRSAFISYIFVNKIRSNRFKLLRIVKLIMAEYNFYKAEGCAKKCFLKI